MLSKVTVPASSDWVSGQIAQRCWASLVQSAFQPFVYVCAKAHMWKVLSGPRDGIQVVRLAHNHFYPLSHLTTSEGGPQTSKCMYS